MLVLLDLELTISDKVLIFLLGISEIQRKGPYCLCTCAVIPDPANASQVPFLKCNCTYIKTVYCGHRSLLNEHTKSLLKTLSSTCWNLEFSRCN